MVAAEEETTPEEAMWWLQQHGILPEGQLGGAEALCRFQAFSKCKLGEGVMEEAQQ